MSRQSPSKRRAYRQAHQEYIRAYRRAYYRQNKAKYLAHNRSYIETHREEVRAQSREYWRRHKDERQIYFRGYIRSLKMETFEHYGGAHCLCCGENHFEFLTLDHIGGGGAEHKRQLAVSGGYALYRRLKKQGFPSGLRVLCWNCNCSLGMYGYCPHGNIQVEKQQADVNNGHHPQQLPLFGEVS